MLETNDAENSWNYNTNLIRLAGVRKRLCLSGKNYQSRCKKWNILERYFVNFEQVGKYSLKEAAGESCSISQLSRFELGESDLAVSRFFEILDNIHVTIENFMDKARDFQNHEHVAMMGQIVPLYYSNDIAGFQKLQREQLEKAKSSTNPLYFELNWIFATRSDLSKRFELWYEAGWFG